MRDLNAEREYAGRGAGRGGSVLRPELRPQLTRPPGGKSRIGRRTAVSRDDRGDVAACGLAILDWDANPDPRLDHVEGIHARCSMTVAERVSGLDRRGTFGLWEPH